MIEPELKEHLSTINTTLTEIKNKKNPGIWRSFFNGMFGALGYIAGVAIVVVVLGFVLQKLGLIEPMRQQYNSFIDLMNSAKKLIPSDQSSSTTNKQSGGETIVTLPNGEQVKVNLQQSTGQ